MFFQVIIMFQGALHVIHVYSFEEEIGTRNLNIWNISEVLM